MATVTRLAELANTTAGGGAGAYAKGFRALYLRLQDSGVLTHGGVSVTRHYGGLMIKMLGKPGPDRIRAWARIICGTYDPDALVKMLEGMAASLEELRASSVWDENMGAGFGWVTRKGVTKGLWFKVAV